MKLFKVRLSSDVFLNEIRVTATKCYMASTIWPNTRAMAKKCSSNNLKQRFCYVQGILKFSQISLHSLIIKEAGQLKSL